jgi:hypothetical protein
MERNYLMLSLPDAFVNLSRHSRENGNPVIRPALRSRHIAFLVSLREGHCIDWIPAFAGMTE